MTTATLCAVVILGFTVFLAAALLQPLGEPVDAEHVPGCNPGCDETGHVLGGDGS